MEARELAEYWLEHSTNEALNAELSSLIDSSNADEIEDAFFQDLSFGTAGLRGIIGPGTNRMNIYTVGRATQGLANYISTYSKSQTPRVAIARDSRNMGQIFVEHAASVLAANGIAVYIFPRIEPTPALSFAVRELGCDSGICMTASHNPANYNGYKVYGSDGCQITSNAAACISSEIAKIDPFTQVKKLDFNQAVEEGLISWIDDSLLNRFVEAVLACRLLPSRQSPMDVSVVYTPLCGTGLECIERVFASMGLQNLNLVEEQASPNGNFPTCTYPNPEEKAALEKGIEVCMRTGADILLATDPDADRVGVALRHENEYLLPTGNEIGILLLHYICSIRQQNGNMPKHALCISTIVSSAMIDAIAEDFGVEVQRTLTGFKYIGDIITSLEAKGEAQRFILGFEESYGYLTGTHVRDKDAINACALIVEMANYYKHTGATLIDVLEMLYKKYGYYANRTINKAFPGAQGAKRMAEIMSNLKNCPLDTIAGFAVEECIDYAQGHKGLPAADVVEFRLQSGQKLIFRPSGTEPKIKVYVFAKAYTKDESIAMLDTLERAAYALTD